LAAAGVLTLSAATLIVPAMAVKLAVEALQHGAVRTSGRLVRRRRESGSSRG